MPDASEAQIRRRFKELARRMHPDRFQGEEKENAELEFQSVTEAFNTLADSNRRREHDFDLAQMLAGHEDRDADRVLRVYLQRGQKAFRERRWAEAAESFRRGTEERPDNASAWYQLAMACFKNPRWKTQAVEAVTRACALEPMNVEYLKLGGQILGRAGLSTRAEKLYTEALHWGGDDPAIEQAIAELRRAR